MNLKTDEITKVIQDQIKNYGAKTKQDEIGYVIQVGDGIAKVHGLDRCRANELLRFDGGAVGMALNLEEDVDKRKHAKLIDSFIENLGEPL